MRFHECDRVSRITVEVRSLVASLQYLFKVTSSSYSRFSAPLELTFWILLCCYYTMISLSQFSQGMPVFICTNAFSKVAKIVAFDESSCALLVRE